MERINENPYLVPIPYGDWDATPKTRREKVLALARHLFPDWRILTADDPAVRSAAAPDTNPSTAARSAEIQAWRARHMAMSDAEFSAVLVAAKEQHERRIDEAADQRRSFHQPHAAADCEHASKLARWTLDESVPYLLGKAPEYVNWHTLGPLTRRREFGSPSLFAVQFAKIRELVLRAEQCRELTFPVRPADLVAWAQRMGIAVAPEMLRAVEAHERRAGSTAGQPPAPAEAAQVAGDRLPLVDEPAPIESSLPDAVKSHSETPLDRGVRLQGRLDQLKAQGVRNFAARVAKEEGITPGRLRQILGRKTKAPALTPPPASEWLSPLPSALGPTGGLSTAR